MLINDINTNGNALDQLKMAYMLGFELDKAKEEIQHLSSLKQQADIEITSLKEEVARLKEQLQLAQTHRFGKKSEVGEPISNLDKSIVVAAHSRKISKKSCGRTIDTSQLPRYTIRHDLL